MRSLPKAMHWLAQPHSGWTSSSASGASSCQRSMSAGRMPACTWHSPIQIFSLRPVTRSSQTPEEEVGQEQDLAVLGDRLDHGLRVARRAAVVALGLHLGGRVHVRDDDAAGMLRLPGAQLVGGDRRGERAAGVEVGDQHGLVGREDRGRLGHEVDAAEDDHLRRRSPRPPGTGRASRRRNRPRPAPRAPGSCARGSRLPARAARARTSSWSVAISAVVIPSSSETSRERAEWVSAPTETKSTPVSAISRTVSSETPPEASSVALPCDELDGFAHERRRHVVEQDLLRAGGERLAHVVQRLGLDLDRQAASGAREGARRPARPRPRRAGGCP